MATLSRPTAPTTLFEAFVPSESQRAAIEAVPGPWLVLAGPGAGKTFCLIERIRHLIHRRGFDPARICAFTFTNKAAGEIAERLTRSLGEHAALVKTGTIHSLCAELLREMGARATLKPGFGIADEIYQRTVLRRLGVQPQWHNGTFNRFAAHRFRGERLQAKDADVFTRYEKFLAERNVLDFDMLLIRAASLLEDPEAADAIRARWDCVLVDEFQDLNPVQYAIVKALGQGHRNIFAVGDDEQSIYSWAGADPSVFLTFTNDFQIATKLQLLDNRRCPRQVMALARKLVEINPPIFTDRKVNEVLRDSSFPVCALSFPTEDAEIAWVVDDLRRDREENGLVWGDFALLYRQHKVGDAAEAGFLTAGLPCRLAQGRALGEDPACAYVIAAVNVIASPDEIHQEGFFEVVLPKPLTQQARAKADEHKRTFLDQLDHMARELPKEDGDGRKIRRGFSALKNLPALGVRHRTLTSLVEELLSQRVGEYRTSLEEHHDELSDPLGHDEVVALAARLERALADRSAVWIPRVGGLEIALKGMLTGIGIGPVLLGGARPSDAVALAPSDAPVLGIGLALFKAAQLARSRGFTNAFRDFTAIDVETTDRDDACEIVEMGAARVRDGKIVAELRRLVRPRVPIAPGATDIHRIGESDVAGAPYFETVWPEFRAFCGDDIVVAHNGYRFDFQILRRMTASLPDGFEMSTYDTLPLARDVQSGSARLQDLARRYGVDPGRSHSALDDARALAGVFLALGEAKVVRARKTALVNLLDHLGLALALSDDDGLTPETELLRRLCRVYALGRYSDCLEMYRLERDRCDDARLPTVADVIERLGGETLMRRIRAERSADDRYPSAMARLRRLLEQCTGDTLQEQMSRFLERVALSRADGVDPERERVNLLTLHSTKGLEFSRVYVLGVEDAQLIGGSFNKPATKSEVEEARRLLYVGMTRAKERLVLTRVEARGGKPTGGHTFLDEMGLSPRNVT
ncbi:MAG TPA: UvrD-helicase domain-containing protein [Gemmatimonadaceae bacterium]|jgi:superfamily I DNA/RNA helicase/DNA polymerase III epsilon subunit-like protein|nr:UvrD-helicase domain-containing protein [Gemmatimonadaceae bacterium]